jgi:hypothetical protein
MNTEDTESTERNAETMSDGVEMLTGQSDSVALYQKLCEAVYEIEGLRRERDEARGEIKRLRYEAQREAEHHDRMVREMEGNEHLCDSHRDMLGNCIVCQMEERHGKLHSMSNGGGAKS